MRFGSRRLVIEEAKDEPRVERRPRGTISINTYGAVSKRAGINSLQSAGT